MGVCGLLGAKGGESMTTITLPRATVQRALEALEVEREWQDGPMPHLDPVLAAIRAALKQPQAEPVSHLWECLGRWSAYIASEGKDANLAPPAWLCDAINAATSPQADHSEDALNMVAATADRTGELEALLREAAEYLRWGTNYSMNREELIARIDAALGGKT